MSKPSYEDLIKGAKKARLIPIVADTNKEERAVSIFLSSLVAVHEFRKVMLGSLGHRMGNRASLTAYTEIPIKGNKKSDEKDSRADGLIVLSTGRKKWTALIEAKIDNNTVSENQLLSYIKQAREHGIDAVITLTNEFAAIPTHHPVDPPRNKVGKTELYHWSWTYALTQAHLLLQTDGIEDPDQAYLLNEVVQFFEAKGSGIKAFDSMNPEWKEVVRKAAGGSLPSKDSDEITKTVSCWHQEQRDLCLKLSRKINNNVNIKLARNHKNDPRKRINDDAKKLIEKGFLSLTLEIANTASDIIVYSTLSTQEIRYSMKVDANRDRKGTKARLNWLLRQLPKEDKSAWAKGYFIRAIQKGPGQIPEKPLSKVMADPDLLSDLVSGSPATAFEIFYTPDITGKFSGNRIFIEKLEEAAEHFYKHVGENLKAWVPSPPKMQSQKKNESETSQEDTEMESDSGSTDETSTTAPD